MMSDSVTSQYDNIQMQPGFKKRYKTVHGANIHIEFTFDTAVHLIKDISTSYVY